MIDQQPMRFKQVVGRNGRIVGRLMPLVVADVMKGTGRFNLAQGMFGTLMGIGASPSPILSGLVHYFGYLAGFLILAAEGLVALAVLAVFLPETNEKLAAHQLTLASRGIAR